jgi:hypothetical protein
VLFLANSECPSRRLTVAGSTRAHCLVSEKCAAVSVGTARLLLVSRLLFVPSRLRGSPHSALCVCLLRRIDGRLRLNSEM